MLYGVLGLIIGLFESIGSLFRFGTSPRDTYPITGTGWDIIPMLLLYPLFTALAGAISGLVIAWIYNRIARVTKGVLIEYTEAGRHDE